MKKIHLYIFKEFFPPIVIGTAFFTFVFIIPQVKNVLTLTFEKGIPFRITLQLFIYSIPFTGSITIPMGVLFGTLFSIGRFSGDNEITAMRSMGLSYFTILRPTLLFGCIMTIFTFLFINFIAPESTVRYKTLYTHVVYSNPSILIEDRTFSEIPNTTKKIAALNVDGDNDVMQEVFLYELEEAKDEITFTYAKKGRWINNTINSKLTSLELSDGETIKINRHNPNEIQKLGFDSITINIFNDVKEITNIVRQPYEQNIFQIRKTITETLNAGETVSPITYIEYHKKYSLPLACIIFVFTALPLGISFRRGGKGASFGVAIVIIFVYYFVMTTAETLGKRGFIEPAISTYLPNMLFIVLAILLSFFKLRN
ncbi:lipopolysaccharide export system permease protein LptF [Spirochaetota bacterium]|nr:lipopolysaccharide export system permease protein LptF [Spirochaetota bacterium]